MTTCPKCNAPIADGMKFCEECGTPIPAAAPPKPDTDTPMAAMSLGDKNVISGDIIQQKTTYNVQGNIVNETVSDETKLVKECYVCGKHVANDQGFTCPKCGKFVCEKHFDIKVRLCKTCSEADKISRLNEYSELYHQLVEKTNDVLGIEERKQLDEARERLGLTESEVAGADYRIDQGLSRIEILEVQNAMKALLTGDASESLPKIEKINTDHEGRGYEQNDVYVQMLKFMDREKFQEIPSGDMGMLANIELAVIDRKFYDAEQQIFYFRKCYGDLSMNSCATASEHTAVEYAYLYSVLGCEYEKPELSQKSAEYIDEALKLRDSDEYKRTLEFYTNRAIVEDYWLAFIKFIKAMNKAVAEGNKEVFANWPPFWKFMATPYKVLCPVEAKQAEMTKAPVLGKKDADELNSLVESWKQQVQEKQQKTARVQDAIAKVAARHEEEALKQSEAAAAEAAKLKAILAAKAAEHDEEERQRQELLQAREAKKLAKLNREAEAEARRDAREEERLRKAQEREAERARKEAEKIRRAQIAASVQPFPVEGEYVFKYRDKMGVVSEKMGNQVFVCDGLRFRCSDPRDPFGGAKTFLLEGVIEIKENDDDETSTDALALFREHEMDPEDYNPFGNAELDEEDSTESNDIAMPPHHPFTSKETVAALKDLTSAFKESSSRLSEGMNKVLKKTSVPLASDFAGESIEEEIPKGKKKVNKMIYIGLALLLGWLGVHKFYSGKPVKGVIYLIFFWTYIPFLISLVEAILAFTKPTDGNGNILV